MLDLTTWISEIRTAVEGPDENGKISAWSKIAPRLGPMFQAIQDGINQTAKAVGVDSTTLAQQPNPPAKLNVKVAGELAHVTIEDNSARDRSLNNFVEYSTTPSFSPASTWTEHLGAARHRVLNLPTKGDSGATHQWYFRAHTMGLGSEKASPHVYLGQEEAPTPVSMAGTTSLTLQPSTGCGTTPSNGQKAGEGFGKAQNSNETFKGK
jgi:hypothetical protein